MDHRVEPGGDEIGQAGSFGASRNRFAASSAAMTMF
jgi:hypothetical protein